MKDADAPLCCFSGLSSKQQQTRAALHSYTLINLLVVKPHTGTLTDACLLCCGSVTLQRRLDDKGGAATACYVTLYLSLCGAFLQSGAAVAL